MPEQPSWRSRSRPISPSSNWPIEAVDRHQRNPVGHHLPRRGADADDAPFCDTDPGRAEAMIACTPLEPEDVAHACLFLFSDKALLIAGIGLVIDSEFMAKPWSGAPTAVTR